MTPPVIDYGRMKRLHSGEENMTMTHMCIIVIFVFCMYLFKRFKDKQKRYHI